MQQTLLVVGILIGIAGARYYKHAITYARLALTFVGIIPPRQSPRVRKGRDRLQKNPVCAQSPRSTDRVAVLVTAGQSNAANHCAVGETNDTPDNASVLNFHAGECFVARHPLLGATGVNQSPWIETARLLIEQKKFDKVVIVATGIGGTGMHEWGSGEFYERLLSRVKEAKDSGLTPTHFLWHQGEYDGVYKKCPRQYFANFKTMIEGVRSISPIPVYIALATRCQYNGPNEEIRSAQRRIASEIPDVSLAVDSDALGLGYRYDGCHLTKEGMHKLAASYAAAIH